MGEKVGTPRASQRGGVTLTGLRDRDSSLAPRWGPLRLGAQRVPLEESWPQTLPGGGRGTVTWLSPARLAPTHTPGTPWPRPHPAQAPPRAQRTLAVVGMPSPLGFCSSFLATTDLSSSGLSGSPLRGKTKKAPQDFGPRWVCPAPWCQGPPAPRAAVAEEAALTSSCAFSPRPWPSGQTSGSLPRPGCPLRWPGRH